MKKIAYFLSHPIQYQTPLLQKLRTLNTIDLEVVYFTDHTIGGYDKQFGINVKWDIPLLEGYNYTFLKNYSLKPAVSGSFFGLINFGLIKYLIKKKPDAIIIHGWGYFSNILLLLTTLFLRTKVIMRAESPLKQEQGKGKLNKLLKKLAMKLCDNFLYIGEENKAFYLDLGVKENQLFYAPYVVDNQRFLNDIHNYNKEKDDLRLKLNIPLENRIALFCGKLINKKRPLDILKAYHKSKNINLSIIFIGTGHLEEELKFFTQKNQLTNIYFLGFVNQTELYKYYLSSDFFILPSGYGETWGLVVNEAMLYSLPLLISDMVGSTADLVKEKENGFTYPCGNIDELSKLLNHFCSLSKEELETMGKNSLKIIEKYSYKEVLEGFNKAIND